MNADELRLHYRRVAETLRKERVWRLKVFPKGHAQHAVKIGEIDAALESLAALGQAIKLQLDQEEVPYDQPSLLDIPLVGGRYV